MFGVLVKIKILENYKIPETKVKEFFNLIIFFIFENQVMAFSMMSVISLYV